jgi:pimeloyl-ACP methyl ester carboxylesterase
MSPPLVLLHGALGTGAQCAPLANWLGPHLSEVRALHMPEFEGHGATPSFGRPFRIEHLAENVLAMFDAHGIASADVFGYSMGGYVALWLARHHPSRIRRVMTLATKLRWNAELAAREAAMLDAAKMREKVPRFAAELEARHGAGWSDVVDATREMMRFMGDHAPLGVDDMRAITIPVRLAVGDRDATVSVDECVEGRALLAQGELEVLPATAHPFERVPLPRLGRSVLEFFG